MAQVDVENRWLALFVGIVGLGLLGQVPVVGCLITLATFLLGLGGVTLTIFRSWRGRGGGGAPDTPSDVEGGDHDVTTT